MVDGRVGIPKVGLQFFYYLKTLSHYVICKVLTFNFLTFFESKLVGEEYIEGWLQKSFEESNVVIVDPCPTLTVSLFCFIVAVQQTSVWQENCGKNNEISQYKHINQP